MSAHVCVALGMERYAVAVEHVREVADLGTVVPVPGAAAWFAGIRHLHGDILPVVLMHDLLTAPVGHPRRILVVHDDDRFAGLAVDSAYEIADLPPPDAPGTALTLGSVQHGDTVMGVLDIPAILDAVRMR
jgi:purine-binding chemotaxis protein CheW